MRHKDANWDLPSPKVNTWEQAQTAVLMDIRDELKVLNRLLNCINFRDIPRKLDVIAQNTKRPKRRKKLKLKVAT